MSAKTLKWINTIAFTAMVLVNMLANIIPIGIGNTGEVSEKYPNLFTPAPVTFAIWGVIYLFMLAFVLYQWGLFDKSGQSDIVRKRVGLWFALSCLLNIGWIFTWHFDLITLSAVMILALLGSLIIITRIIKALSFSGWAFRLSVSAGFDIYFGWIIAATIANMAVMLTAWGWNGFGLGEQFWTVAVLLAGAVIGTLTVFIDRKVLPALSVIWAYTGILIKHISQDGYKGFYSSVIIATIIGIIIMTTGLLLNFYRKKYCVSDKITDYAKKAI